MRQTFEVVFEHRASDRGYTQEELHELLDEALGREYDIVWHSVKEVPMSLDLQFTQEDEENK